MSASSKAPSLNVGEPEAFASKLRAKKAVLLLEILDHLLVVTVRPAGEDQHQEPQWEPIHESRLTR
jgi:hypothetical protein